MGETENLTELENLNEETLLKELQARYARDVIYTYVGAKATAAKRDWREKRKIKRQTLAPRRR